jgi:hypothetical protein
MPGTMKMAVGFGLGLRSQFGYKIKVEALSNHETIFVFGSYAMLYACLPQAGALRYAILINQEEVLQ